MLLPGKEHVSCWVKSVTNVLSPLPCRDMVSCWVKSVTAARQCRLVDLAGFIPEDDVGPPSYFVCHVWANPFMLLLDEVAAFLQGADEATRVWLDIAAVNQHVGLQVWIIILGLRVWIDM